MHLWFIHYKLLTLHAILKPFSMRLAVEQIASYDSPGPTERLHFYFQYEYDVTVVRTKTFSARRETLRDAIAATGKWKVPSLNNKVEW